MKRKVDKKGQLAGGLVMGVVGLVLTLVLAFVFISTLNNANILTAGSSEANTVTNLSTNLTAGVTQISTKIVTMFSIIAIVVIFGFLLFLWARFQQMKLGGSTGTL